MVNTESTTLSLFSGTGGLDLGWQLATGSRTVGYCEREAFCASILLARMEDQALEPAPIWCGDVCELPLEPFRGVDGIIGGFPCQDISAAGRGAGIYGERSGLWGRGFVRAIRELRPRYVFAENVQNLRSRGLGVVIQDLARLGYDTQWCCISAKSVGASHLRRRIFILAYAKRAERCPQHEPRNAQGWNAVPQRSEGAGGLGERREELGNAERQGREGAGGELVGERRLPRWTNNTLDDPHGVRRRAQSDASIASEQLDSPIPLLFAPGPADDDDWHRILIEAPHLAPAIESGVRVLGNGDALVVDESRADQLRAIGNGVVPLQAAVAARILLSRAEE